MRLSIYLRTTMQLMNGRRLIGGTSRVRTLRMPFLQRCPASRAKLLLPREIKLLFHDA